jgi:hypothetical protein
MQTQFDFVIAAKPIVKAQVIKPKRSKLDLEQRTLDFDAPLYRDLSLVFVATYCGFGIYRKGLSWVAGHDPREYKSRKAAERSAARQSGAMPKLALELEAQKRHVPNRKVKPDEAIFYPERKVEAPF